MLFLLPCDISFDAQRVQLAFWAVSTQCWVMLNFEDDTQSGEQEETERLFLMQILADCIFFLCKTE